jgi:Flp pilus assembly protein TadG
MLEYLRSFWRDRDGSALLEATLLTPVLFALVFGVYEFSWYFYRQHLISTGVRDAARYLARTNVNNPCSSGSNKTVAKNIATLNSDGGARVKGWTASNVTIACTTVSRFVCGADTPCELNSGPNAYDVYIVTVSTSYTPSTLGFLGFFGFSAPSIAVSHQERAVGQG